MYDTGKRYGSTDASSNNASYEEQMQPVQSEIEDEFEDSELESVYSCDSLLDETNDADYDDDDDPFDLKTKQYLAAHSKELKFPQLNKLQQYAASKVRNVLSRGTLSEKKTQSKLAAIRKMLPRYKVKTDEYAEALDLQKDIDSYIANDRKPTSKAEKFNNIVKSVTNYFNPEMVGQVPESELKEITDEGSQPLKDIWKLTMDLVSSSSDEEQQVKGKNDSSGDESVDLKSLSNIDFIFPTKDEVQYTPSFVGSKSATPRSQPKTEGSAHRSTGSRGRKMTSQEQFSSRKLEKEDKCSERMNYEELKIYKKELIILFKEKLYRKLHNHMYAMQVDRRIMRHKLLRVWSSRQQDGLDLLGKDISRRKRRLADRIERVQKQSELNKTATKAVRREKTTPKILPEMYGTKNRRWKRTRDCMRDKEKILLEKQGANFLSGFLDDRAAIKTERTLGKEWPEVPSILGVPPPPPRSNRRLLAIISNFTEAKNTNMTYGDLMRLMEGDASFIMEDELGPVPDEGIGSREVSNTKQFEESKAEHTKRPNCREWDEFIRRDNATECPFLTEHELKSYTKMLDETFYPDPNFEIAKECVAIDENALIISDPEILKMNYSFKDLRKDFYRANRMKCAHCRAVYFFQYKSEFSPIDIQAAYEQYIYGNIGSGDTSDDHPCGCLLIYRSVKQAIVMIEGQVDHVYYHFADFRNSRLYQFIEIGRVLYYADRKSCILDNWVSLVADPQPGEIQYFSKSKKILHRVAEARVFHIKNKLHDLYSYLSSQVNIEAIGNREERDEPIPSSIKDLIHTCPCEKSDLKGKSESGLSLDEQNQASETKEKKTDITVQELLPAPALVAYLLKYRKLRTIDRFLDDFVMQPEIGSEDEKFNVFEDALSSNYVDSDDEKDKPRIIREMKRICKERDIITNCYEELMNILDKPEVEPPWAKSYDTSRFTPKLKKVQVRNNRDKVSSTIDVDPLIDSDESEKLQQEEQYVKWHHEGENFAARRKLLNFLDTGAESWQKKVKLFNLKGCQIKEILQEAHNYKTLRKILQFQDEIKATEENISEEEGNLEEMNDDLADERSGSDKEVSAESNASLLLDTVDEIEALLEDYEGETYQYLGEDIWPQLTGFERMGEYPERFGEGRFDIGFNTLEWDGEENAELVSRVKELSETVQVSSDIGESLADNTPVMADDQETIPEAPPATSVTDSSTDP